MRSFIKSILIAIIGGLTVVVFQQLGKEEKQKDVYEHTQNSIPTRHVNYLEQGKLPDFTEIAESAVHTVVHVKALLSENMADNPLVEFFFGYKNPESEPVVSAGSGVIISGDGYIITNNHVIGKGARIKVVLNDKRSYFAKIIGTDEATDLALLKIEETNLPYMRYGNSDDIKIGEWALAIGNPFNLTSTVTAGIISAKARDINLLNTKYAIESFIQTDAAVNPGNSGGALIDGKGLLVGINTAIASRTGSFTGYSFAVPVNIAQKVVADLIEFGAVQRALLGIGIRDVDAEYAKTLKLDKIEGVYVESVSDFGAAKEAGIKIGDLITKVETVTVNKVSELQEQISKYRPGDVVEITILRKKETLKMKVTLQNKMGNTSLIKSGKIDVFGASFEELTEQEISHMDISGGIRVSSISAGKLLKAGIREGFIITKVNRQDVTSIADLKKILDNYSGGVYIEGIHQDGTTAYYAFGINSK